MRNIARWASVLLIFTIPWEDSISVSSLGSLARAMGLLVAGLWMATILLEGRFRKPHAFHALVLIFFLWNFASVFWSPDVDTTVQRIKTYSQIFLLLLIFWEFFETPEHLMAGLQAYVLGAYVLVASALYNYASGTVAVAYEGRYSATGVNAVDLALILMIGLPLAMQLFFVAGKGAKGLFWKLLNLAFIPLAVFAIILTGSRTSLIAIVPFGIFLVTTGKIPLNRKMQIFAILLVAALMLLPFVPTSVTSRLSTLGSSIEAGDLGGRVALWLESIKLLATHPFFGIGSGALDMAIGSAAHNTFVSVATETGTFGFLFFFLMLVIVFHEAANLPNGNAGLWLAVFFTWVIGVLSLSWEFRKLTWVLLNLIVIEGSIVRDRRLADLAEKHAAASQPPVIAFVE